jgi:glycosyltransferase involved in cell wall biosynthesis
MQHSMASVIVITKNSEKFLKECLDSVMMNERHIAEILLIDAASTDDTLTIARTYPLVKVIAQNGIGIAAAYNTGIAAATSEYLAFNSSDDLWSPTKLEEQLPPLAQQPASAFSVGKVEFFLNDPAVVPPGFRRELLQKPITGYIMETLVAHRNVFKSVGGFDETLKTAEDVDWFSRARDVQVPGICVDAVVLRKRVHESNSSLRKENDQSLLAAVHKAVQRKRLQRSDD